MDPNETVHRLLRTSIKSGNISMWLHGLGSQPQLTVPTNSFYGIQEQGHQGSTILRQAQHPTQMGTTGYTNSYHTQQLGGISREHQHLLPSLQKNMNGSQGQSSQQSHQHWQHSY